MKKYGVRTSAPLESKKNPGAGTSVPSNEDNNLNGTKVPAPVSVEIIVKYKKQSKE